MRILVALFLLACTAVVSHAAEPTGELSSAVSELQARLAELQQVRQSYESQRRAYRQQREELEQQLDRLRTDRQSVEPLVQQQRRELDKLNAQHADTSKRIRQLADQLTAITDAARPAASRLGEQVQAALAYNKDERHQAIQSITDQLALPELAAQADGVQALASWAGEEMQLARSREIWNAPLLLDGGEKRLNGYHARLGLIAHLFLGEDGQTVRMTTGGQWQFQLPPKQQQQVITLVRMLQGQAPPAVTPLPLPTSSQAAAGEGTP